MNNRIVNIDVSDNYRIIAISDIHGHYDILKGLMKKVDLRDEDFLVIIGDFINKGSNSYKTYKYIEELSKRKNTFILKGNHEMNIQRVMSDKNKFESIHDFIKEEYYETIIHSLLRETNRSLDDFDTIHCLYDYLQNKHCDVFDFLGELPIVLNIDEFRFVHGGYDEDFCIENEEKKFLKFDNYNELSKVNEKRTVVGHWPTCILREDRILNVPYFNNEKNIIFIDGGLGVKITGELNALIIEKRDGDILFDNYQHNNFIKKRVKKLHEFITEDTVYVNYPHYDFEVIEAGNKMTRCKHKQSQKEFTVFNSLLNEKDGIYELKMTYVNNFLNLDIDEEVEVCFENDDCSLVKHKNIFGWLLSEQLS